MSSLRRIGCFFLMIGLASIPAAGQTTFATITGTITDATGSVVAGASVEAVQLGSNYRYTAKANEAGVYTLAQLRDGVYTLRAQATGFKEFVVHDLQLLPRDNRRIDVVLQVGAVETKVEVTAGATLIETETARIADTKGIRVLRALPMTNRGTWAYLQVVPGMLKANGDWAMRFAGSRSFQSETTIDGITSAKANGSGQIAPLMESMEHVQEMRFDMANNTAEFGTVGQLGIVTKSGANQVHGSAFDYYSTPMFRARDPFALERPAGVRHKMGFSLGGPIYLPKIYNGHDKSFFFVTYERDAGSQTTELFNPTVPLAAWREGDFSGLGAGTVVRNPLANNAPLPGNRIPASQTNPLSKRLQERFYPLPNFGDTAVFASQNYREQRTRPYEPDNFVTFRVDHRFSDQAFVFGRAIFDNQKDSSYEGNLPTIGQRIADRPVRSANISYTHTLRSNLLNEFRWGLAFNNAPWQGPVRGKQLVQELGLVGLADDLPDISGIFKLNFSGLGLTGVSQVDYRVPGNRTLIHQFQDHTSWFHGRHSVKVGGQLTRGNTQICKQSADLFGNVTFSNRFAGHPYADFLFGIPTTARRGFPAMIDNTLRWSYGVFVTDEFKVTPKLTLNLGLRYELHAPWTEANGRLSMFDIESGRIVVPDGSLSRVSPLVPRNYVSVVEASQAGLPASALRRADRNNLAPRVGVAYRPWGSSTVLRAGYGIYYDIAPRQPNTGGSPFVISEPAFTNPAAAPVVIFPRVFPAQGSGGPATISLPAGGRTDLRIPFSMQYNLTVEHQRWDTGFRISYIGTNTRQGVWGHNINQPLADTRRFIDKPRRFPNYPNINYTTNGAGHQYHSLTLQADRHMARGLYFQTAYLWARDIGDLENGDTPENAYNRRRERGVWSDIPTHRLSTNLVYELPVGRGKRFLAGGGRVMNALASGWEVSGIYLVASGQFLTPSWTGSDPTGTAYTASATPAQVTIRPNHLRDANLPAGERSVNRWFDAGAFSAPTPGSFGTSARGVIKGPGRNVMHTGIAKYFHLRERLRIRWELTASNVMNHPNWANPTTNITSAGQVAVIGAIPSDDQTIDTARQRDIRMLLRVEW